MRYFLYIVSVILTINFSVAQRIGDLCVIAGTIQPGVCRHILRCPAALEATFNGIPHQVCANPDNRLIVCCPWVPGQETGLQARCPANTATPREDDNCTMVDTGRAGVCSRFANCQTAIEAASKGISPQICAVEGTVPIVCCPRLTATEGDQCTVTETGRTGKCLQLSKCPVAVQAALKGMTPQICTLDGSIPVVCCEGVVEGDYCTMVNTGRAGVCRPFTNCQAAKDAAYKGILPQTCDTEGTVQVVCCPLETVVKGDNCTMGDTGRAGVCRPFANCQAAKEAAYTGILPHTCDAEGTVQVVCCPLVAVVEGDNCTMVDTGRMGVCRPFANCQSAKKAASRGIFEQKCDLTDNESKLVCCTMYDCPPLLKGLVTQLPIGSKAADYCINLAEKIHPCQETRSGWTRGDTCPLTPDSNTEYKFTPLTTAAEAPHYGRMGTGQRGDVTWQGYPVTLVSDRFVLCSAYAIDDIESNNVHVQFVGLGGTFTPSYNPDEIYGVIKQHTHPLYDNNYSYGYNSIVLLQLDREVTFTGRILPVCLHTGTPLPNTGFILTGSSNEHKTTMQIVSAEECSRVIAADSYGWHPDGIKHDQEICSRPVNTTGGCEGWYLGSPLTLPNSHRVACTHLLVGLKTYRSYSSCIVTNNRISAFIPWIESIVWPESGVV